MEDGGEGAGARAVLVPLSGIIAACDGTPYADENEVVDYYGALNSSMIMRGCVDSSSKNMAFRVGVRGPRGNIPRPLPEHRVDTSMGMGEEFMRSCEQMNRTNQSMPVSWPRVDLFGTARRLAMACAHYAVWGRLTPAEIRGGGNVQIAAIAATTDPISADNGAVFVSTKLVSHSDPNLLCAFANSITGEGGTMYCDLLGVTPTGVIRTPNAQNAALAQGCHGALRILESVFEGSGHGAFFCLAVAQGVHRIMSFHGHSDEGAFTRDVFRAGEAGVPYGAIPIDAVQGNSMPNPQRSVAGFRSVYVSIGLASAGAVALADPMVDIDGRMFPTILSTDRGDFADPGDDNAGDADDSADLTTQWAESSGEWSKYYAHALNEVFNTSGGIDLVCRHLTMQANSLAGTDNRHMRFKVAVAFWWIEPSCSCPVGNNFFPAFVANHGPLAIRHSERVVPALDGVAILTDRSDHLRTTIQVDYRYARRHALIIHLNQHARDGTGHIILESGVVNDFTLVGGAGNMGPRILAQNRLNTYLWGRGLSTVIAGGELVSVSRTLVFTVVSTHAPRNGIIRNTHTPRADELVSGDVTFNVSMLMGGPPGVPGAVPPRDIRRARTRAATAITGAADSRRAAHIINEQLMRPTLIDFGPLPQGTGATIRQPSRTEIIPAAVGAVDGNNPFIPDADVANRTGAAVNGGVANGPAAPVRIENRRDRGPRPPRAGRAGFGGAMPAGRGGGPAAPIPPVGANVPAAPNIPPVPPVPPAPPNLPSQGAGAGNNGTGAAAANQANAQASNSSNSGGTPGVTSADV
uniref:Capsid n=1 Tax=viral metagenome TaxID=1070528 RepID=A0A2V0RNE1_9ZZZZ